MNKNYDRVPNIITGKDLDYLSDMFTWNYEAFKKGHEYADKVQDLEIKAMIEKVSNVYHNNLTTILSVLSNGGQNE